MNTNLHQLIRLIMLAILLAACTSKPHELKPEPTGAATGVIAPKEAAELFDRQPRTLARAREAYHSAGASVDSMATFQNSILAARIAGWLAYYSPGREGKIRYARLAIYYAIKAIELKNNSVEGYYYRALATGLYAKQAPLKATGAMQQIRTDLTRAIALDETFDQAGPHRILGGLYLKAPGPPAGIGSKVRALYHLNRAYNLNNRDPNNRLLLAEALIEKGDKDKAFAILAPLNHPQRRNDGIEGENIYTRVQQLIGSRNR